MDVLPPHGMHAGTPTYYACSSEGTLDCRQSNMPPLSDSPLSGDDIATDPGGSDCFEPTSSQELEGRNDKIEFDIGFGETCDTTPIHVSDHSNEPNVSDSPSAKDGENSLAFAPSSSNSARPCTGVGAGLANLGNTCFINSILQCLTHTVSLVKLLRSLAHSSNCEGFCVFCQLRDHIDLCISLSGKVVAPSGFFENLNYFSSYFRKYQQEDAHEFLQCFFDKLAQGCCSSTAEPVNIVDEIFGGRLNSKLWCSNCGYCSERYEPFNNVSLEIDDADNLESALESFTKVEKIDDADAKFVCENCLEQCSMEKQLVIDRLPRVAVFQLKRFKTDGYSVDKITSHVSFPLELNIAPFTDSVEEPEVKYKLYAFIVHEGPSPVAGHYLTYVRSNADTWHKLDDSSVTPIDEDSVISEDVYILFYAEESTPWYSSLVEPVEPSEGSPVSVLNKSVESDPEQEPEPKPEPEPEPEPEPKTPRVSPVSLSWGALLDSPMEYDRIEIKSDVSTSFETPTTASKSKVRGESKEGSASKKVKTTPEMALQKSEAMNYLNKTYMPGNRKTILLNAMLKQDGSKKSPLSCKKTRSPYGFNTLWSSR